MPNQLDNPPIEAAPVGSSPQLGLVADPRSLGLAAFATTTFVFGLSYTTIWDASVASALALALVYGGAIQVLAGIWAFARRLVFPAVTFCSFGAFYVGYYVFVRSIEPTLRGADISTGLAVFLLAWLIFSFYVLIASLRVSGIAAVIQILLDADVPAARHRTDDREHQCGDWRWSSGYCHRGSRLVRICCLPGQPHVPQRPLAALRLQHPLKAHRTTAEASEIPDKIAGQGDRLRLRRHRPWGRPLFPSAKVPGSGRRTDA